MSRFAPILLVPSCLFFGSLLQAANDHLPGTKPLEIEGNIAGQMVEGIHRFLDRRTLESQLTRDRIWNTGNLSQQIEQQKESRDRLRKLIGAVDQRLSMAKMEIVGATQSQSSSGKGHGYRVFRIRWPVFEGVTGEGLLLEPEKKPVARIVAIPDADWSPESLAGIEPGVPSSAQFARKLAELGCQVIIPTIIDRRDTWSGISGIRMTNQPHREFIYRMSYEVGRHIIGYEVQKVLAVIDWFGEQNRESSAYFTGVMGYGEGGLLALFAAALDQRIDRTVVTGYFQSRQDLWKEPIYRNVWGFLEEFDDAELARLIGPNRRLIVETSAGPGVKGPPPETVERRGATPNGTLGPASLESVRYELERAQLGLIPVSPTVIFTGDEIGGYDLPGSNKTIRAFLSGTPAEPLIDRVSPSPKKSERISDSNISVEASARMKRQFDELVCFTQKLIRQSPGIRDALWTNTDPSSPDAWKKSTQTLRNLIWEEVIGQLPAPTLPMNPRTRLIYDEPKFKGYEVMLDVWEDVFAYGILLIPKDLKAGERRPVVVCQHGLEGRPADVADPKSNSPFYHRFGARLAEQGFVIFAPQNPYIGMDRFRLIVRKSHPLKLTLFSFIIGQHQRILEWLGSLPNVDPTRIGFYGLSYGGKTAMRVPTLLDGYALSICSADFNEWIWKTTNVESRYSYMIMNEYDMYEFNLANIANYAELATLMAPRPFMVERGHWDEVAPDEWVAYEFAKASRFYAGKLGIEERCVIEFFNGPHTINGKGTFKFLKKYLAWPGP